MSDIKLIISIPEDEYNIIKKSNAPMTWVEHLIAKGIPLSKNDLGVDAVNRKELLKIYEDRFSELQKLKHLKDNKGAEDRQMGVNYCINILKELPPATPQEPKKGHWISHREHCENLGVMPSGLGAYEWCSKCDCGIDVREWHRNHYNYCPNCGSDNREVEE